VTHCVKLNVHIHVCVVGGASLYHMMHSSCESFNNSFTSLIYCSSDGQKPFGNSSAFDDDVGECVCVL